MMKSMKRRMTTREKILEAAKRSFYRNGYTATTYAHLSQEMKTSPGSFSYYFSSKASMAGEIYVEMLQKLRQIVDDRMPEEAKERPLLKYAVISRLLVDVFHEDEKVFRFYYEFGKDDIEIARNFNLMNVVFPDDEHLSYDEENDERALISSAIKGHSWFTNTDFFNGKLNCSFEYFSDYHLRLNLLMMKVPPEIIERIIEHSRTLAEEIHLEIEPCFVFK